MRRCAATTTSARWTPPRAGTPTAGATPSRRYFAEYDRIGTGGDARNPALLHLETGDGVWRVRQVFDDPDGDHDWGISAEVDLAASDEAGEPVVTVTDVGPHP